jgi:flagellin-specific chaperone FliS
MLRPHHLRLEHSVGLMTLIYTMIYRAEIGRRCKTRGNVLRIQEVTSVYRTIYRTLNGSAKHRGNVLRIQEVTSVYRTIYRTLNGSAKHLGNVLRIQEVTSVYRTIYRAWNGSGKHRPNEVAMVSVHLRTPLLTSTRLKKYLLRKI